jgi:hypothetical protein
MKLNLANPRSQFYDICTARLDPKHHAMALAAQGFLGIKHADRSSSLRLGVCGFVQPAGARELAGDGAIG